MILCLEKQAAHTDDDATAPDGWIVGHDDPSAVHAAVLRGNPMIAPGALETEHDAPRILCWSGSLGDDLISPEMRNWMGPGQEAFDRLCDSLGERGSGATPPICFQPHARHVVSDVPSALKVVRDRPGQGFEIALSPATMLTPEMLDQIDDHLLRMFEVLGPVCSMVMLADVQPVVDDGPLPRGPLGTGLMPRDLLRKLLAEYLAPDTLVAIADDDVDHQREWLGI